MRRRRLMWLPATVVALAVSTAPAAAGSTPPQAGAAGASIAAVAPDVPIPDGTSPTDLPPEGADAEPVGGDQPLAGQATGASVPAMTITADTTRRYFGSGPWAAIKNAAAAQSKCTGLSSAQLQAMVLATIFRESAGATSPGSEPAPMTLSRYDEWSGVKAGNTNVNANYGLYAFRDPNTIYKQAFWHPGIGIWQYDSAGVGAPYTAAERMSTNFLAPIVASGMASRYCGSKATTTAGKRYDAWLPWTLSCDSGTNSPNAAMCEEIYQGLISTNFGNVTVQAGFSESGGVSARTCMFISGATYPCWRVDPSQAQGATWWATMKPLDGGVANRNSSPATPISTPFYVIKRDGTEVRYWMAADSGYNSDIMGTRTLGLNARPKDNQPGSGVTWTPGSGLCDLTVTHGTCGIPLPPAGITNTRKSVMGDFVPVVFDVNGDNIDDILWYAPGGANDALWVGTNRGSFVSLPVNIDGDYQVVAARLNADRFDDLAFYSAKTGELHTWFSNGKGDFTKSTMRVSTGLTLFTLDRDGNGVNELYLHGPGALPDLRIAWSGSRWVTYSTVVSGTYRPFVGDFNGDGRDDIFWYAPGTAPDSIWLSDTSAAGWATVSVQVDATDLVPTVGDIDGDGIDDIVFKEPAADYARIWFGGKQAVFTKITIGGEAGTTTALADLNGDGRKDVVLLGLNGTKDYLLRFARDRSHLTTPLSLGGSQQMLVGRWNGGRDGIFWYGPGNLTDWVWW